MTLSSWFGGCLTLMLAAGGAPEGAITLQQALRHTLENNFDVALERLNVESAQADLEVAASEFDPSLEASLFTRANRSPAASVFSNPEINESDSITGGVGVLGKTSFGASYNLGVETGQSATNSTFQSIDPAYESTLKLEFTQPILKDAGWRVNRWRITAGVANKAIAENRLQASLIQAAETAIEFYWELVFAAENLKTQRELLEWSRQFEGMIRAKVAAGALPPIDIIQAQASTAAAEEQVVVAESQMDRRADMLLKLMNPGIESKLWTEPMTPGPMPSAPPPTPKKRDYTAAARQKRPELAMALKEVESRKAELLYHDNQRLPSLDAVATMRLNGLRGDAQPVVDVTTGETKISQLDGSAPDSFSDAASGKYYNYSLGLRLTWPLGGRGAQGRHAKSLRQMESAVIRLRELEKSVAMEARNARREVVNAAKRFQASSVTRVLAEKKLDAEMKKFEAGASTLFQVVEYRKDLATQRGRELRAVAECFITQARLDKAVGETLEANSLTLDVVPER
ncbi:MAG: TolC family protein [Nitrospinota bacterium]|nr:TolC family protein [Nitrospinota bacterium]